MTDSMSWMMQETEYSMEDFQSSVPRWCDGCGDHAILTAFQRLCRDEKLAPEKTVFVSGIGCSSRFPHYMKTYGFHSLHGRALPIAEGIKIRRPDLHVFVNTGDGDCCSIGTAHWIHALRYNMNMVCVLHDNNVYGLTKMQASPTSPRGLRTNTSPRGAFLEPLNPLSASLGISNVSFVAQAVDWIPGLFYQIISRAFHHKGFSFIRILQRCPNYLPKLFDEVIRDPARTLLLTHENGLQITPDIERTYPHREQHDPSDLNRARELASAPQIPVGILYQNESVPCYEEVRKAQVPMTAETIERVLNQQMDLFSVYPARS